MSDNNDTRQAPADVGQSRQNDWNADPARLHSIREHGEPKTIGIIGSRRRKSKDDYHQLYDALRAIFNDGDYIVSGGCPQGGDFFAEQIARRLGTSIIIHHADWERHGRSAGYKRNSKIALDADVLIALVAADRRGGTEDTIRKYLDLCKGNLIILEAGEKSPAPAPVVMVEETPAPESEYDTSDDARYDEETLLDMAEEEAAQEQPRPTERESLMQWMIQEDFLTIDGVPTAKGKDVLLSDDGRQESLAMDILRAAPRAPEPFATVVVNIKQPYDVYIGRRGHGQDGYFGNPHPVGKPCRHCHGATHTREEAIEAYREDFEKRITDDNIFRQRVLDLAGKRLGCFCAPRPCHGDVIAEWLEHVARQELLSASHARP